jgi:anti-anti-sigma factor
MATRELQVVVRQRDAVAVIDLSGDVDGSAERTLDEAYREATSTAVGSVVLNFEATEYINSTGIALIVGLLAQARKDHVTVSAFGLSAHYREIFDITRLSDFMRIAENEAAAAGYDA